MLNSIEMYQEAGRKAAEARHQHDEARAEHWTQHASRMRNLEAKEDRAAAQDAFRVAYREESAKEIER